MNNFQKYAYLFARLAKLVCIGDSKQVDCRNVLDTIMYRFNKTTVFDDIFTYPEVNNQAGTLGVAREYFYWIQMHGDELLHSIQKLVSDINSWKQMYYSICHINLELKLMEPHNTVSQELQDNYNGQELLSRRDSSLSINPIPEEELEDDNLGFLSNFVGTSKKARYKKLVVEKSEIVKNIMKLNLEIKWSHELIAAEISDFLKFRTEFLRFGIKRYISEEIKLLKQRSTELSKYVFLVRKDK